MTTPEDMPADADAAPDAELAALVIRAGRLGFPRGRVATALGISAGDLAAIEEQARGAGHSRRNDDE